MIRCQGSLVRSLLPSLLLVPSGLLAASALAFSPAARAPAPKGAPLVCFPIEVDAKATLPVAGDRERAAAAAIAPKIVADALAREEDPQFHMELLRRAAMAGEDRPGPEWRELVDLLERSALLAAAEPESADAAVRARLARRFFDLGYALEVGETLHMELGDGAPFLRKASELAPSDAALQFGVALPLYQDSLLSRDPAKKDAASRACLVHLTRALASEDPRLRRNLVSTFGAFMDCSTYEELASAARRKLAGT
jgi:hypothetical protein